MKTALITGAGSGIGQAIAQQFSQAGYEVWLLGRQLPKLEQTQALLVGPSQLVELDLEDLEQVEKTSLRLRSQLSPRGLQVLVHNAGLIRRAPFVESTRHDWEQSFRVHLLGPVLLTQALLPALALARPSSIVTVSSNLGQMPIPNTSSYSALKAALINWTLSLAMELAPQGIRANCVCPGIVDTPIHGRPTEEQREFMGKMQPLGRMGNPQDIARAVFFLGSDQSAWTTGSVLTVDGGISLR
jgi:NAD(P)-dependent dehydrogenase (short-subunit alcohol dehydrogenase family)